MLARAAFFATLALTAPALAEEIACEGAFAADSSAARLVDIYGADNVVTGTVPGPEGTEMLATTVFRGDVRRELQFVWWDEDNLRNPGNIALPSKAITYGGVHIGMTLTELEQANGEPFSFNGFGWDYGGFASFESGNLSDLPGGCSLSVRLMENAYPADVDTMKVNGDVIVQSGDPMLDGMDVRVDSLSLGYPHPDFRD